MKRMTFLSEFAIAIASSLFAVVGLSAEGEASSPQTLFTNVNVFNGTENRLYLRQNVLVEGNLIRSISDGDISVGPAATIIDGGGRTLMPGLIDSHVHFNMMLDGGPSALEAASWEEIGGYATYAAQEWLKNGFTTARDMCGMHHGLRKIIDKGLVAGPRLYLSGGCLSQTSGHGDFRHESGAVGQFDRGKSNTVNLGITRVADGRPAVLEA